MQRDMEPTGPSRCPSRQELGDFSVGRMATVASDVIAAHIGRCDDCQAILDELDQDGDPIITQLRDSFHNPSVNQVEAGRLAVQLESIHDAWCNASTQPRCVEPGSSPLAPDSALQIRCPYCDELSPADEITGTESVVCPKCGGQFGLALEQLGDGELRPGTQIGHFELLAFLGEGSFGTVWKAQDTVLKRPVALKLPRRERFRGRTVENLLREARVAAQVRHPGIVSVYEIGIEEDTVFLAYELVEGDSLESVLGQRRFSVREAAQLCLAMAEALHAAHVAGTVHRDLKPANILLDHAGNPRIADFGLATHSAIDVVVSVEGRILGTPVYMSPEQASGKAGLVDERTDIYSLGVILYRLLAGRPPFGGDIHTLVSQILLEDPIRPRALNTNLPRDLETICLKCLEKKVSKRFQTAEELAAELRLFLNGKPIHSRPASPLERLGRWARRKPALATVSVVAVVLLASTIAALELGRWKAETALQAAERNLYFHRISQAHQIWLTNDVRAAEATLDECPQHFRDFEWRYLKQLMGTPVHKLSNTGTAIAYRPDGLELATGGGNDCYLKIWDTQTERRVHRLSGHTTPLLDLDYSPDGTELVTAGGPDRSVRLWEAVDGDLIRVLGHHDGQVRACSFYADGARVVSYGNDGHVRVWESASGKQLHSMWLDLERVRDVTFSPSTHRLAVASRRGVASEVAVFDYESDSLVVKVPVFESTIGSLAFSLDGCLLAVGEVRGAIRIWQLEPLKLLATIAGPVSEKCRVVFNAAGDQVAAEALDGTVRVWEVERGQVRHTFRGHSRPIYSLAFSPDGQHFAAGTGENRVCIWDLTTEQGSHPYLGGKTNVYDIAVSPDGSLLAAAFDDGRVLVWDSLTARATLTLEGNGLSVRSVAFSPDGRWLATAGDDHTVRILDVNTGDLVFHFTEHTRSLRCVAFSPDGSRVASAGLDRAVRVWDPSTGIVEHLFRMKGPSVRSLAFHRNGLWLAGGGSGGTVAVWNVESGKLLWEEADKTSGRVWDLAYSPEGEFLAVCRGNGTVELRDAADGSCSQIFGNLAHELPVAIAFAPGGRRVATATARTAVSIWEMPTGRGVLSLSRNPSTSGAVAFTPDGQGIITGDVDGIVRLWTAVAPTANSGGKP